MKKSLIFLSASIFALSVHTPANAVSLKSVKRGFKHCTSGKKTFGKVEGACDVYPKTCKTLVLKWCKDKCLHKVKKGEMAPLEKTCGLTTINITNEDTNPVKYQIVAADSRKKLNKEVRYSDTLQPKSSTKANIEKIKLDSRKYDLKPTHAIVFATPTKGFGDTVECKPLELGKNYTITFTEERVGIKCVVAAIS